MRSLMPEQTDSLMPGRLVSRNATVSNNQANKIPFPEGAETERNRLDSDLPITQPKTTPRVVSLESSGPTPVAPNLRKIASMPTATATAGSAFIRRIPPEIRRAILLEALGNRVIHLEQVKPCKNCEIGRRRNQKTVQIGYVCKHEGVPAVNCCFGYAHGGCHNMAVARSQLLAETVGAMGWLLSCRQA